MSEGTKCHICPKGCVIKEDKLGICGARINKGGEVVADNYGKITSIALDPIEKKPLRRFMPGSNILSVGSYGCNFRCSFCQNHRISMNHNPADYIKMSPEQLVSKAVDLLPQGNIGLAYTYNEPLIGYEFVRDCASLAAEKGLLNVVVTNGYVNQEPLRELLPLIDAFNIDLKSFSEKFYKKIGGDLEVVKNSIIIASKKGHVEVTTLIIEGENDGVEEMEELSAWLAGVNPNIPFHVSRFFPAYEMQGRMATSEGTVRRLGKIAGQYLKYVYCGNC